MKTPRFFTSGFASGERQSPQYLPDSETAFALLSEKIESQVSEQLSQSPNQRHKRRWFSLRFWQIAASITFLFGIATWLLREPILHKTYQTDYGQASTFLLADGSRVTLNANSTLTVPRFGFKDEVREVLLKGEAEFSVRHTPTHQRFVVKTSEQVQVEVLGTEFTFFSRPRETKVALSEGKIRLDYEKNSKREELLMKPGELVTLSPSGNLKLQHTDRPELQSAWKEQPLRVRQHFSAGNMRHPIRKFWIRGLPRQRDHCRTDHFRKLQSPDRRRSAGYPAGSAWT